MGHAWPSTAPVTTTSTPMVTSNRTKLERLITEPIAQDANPRTRAGREAERNDGRAADSRTTLEYIHQKSAVSDHPSV